MNKKMTRVLSIVLACILLVGYMPVPVMAKDKDEKEWVIVLDPGHGGKDGGASRTINGEEYIERDLVLKIAKYCKKQLEKEDNIKVYLTRKNNTDPCMDREERAYYAASKGADLLVSLHLNATGSNTTYDDEGAEVYYPNRNYRADISDACWEMSESILDELEELGLENNGSIIRNSKDGKKYPDGSKADSLGINYWSKYYGYAGILVEHAYINNPSDVENFLSTEKALKKLGKADARGIIECLESGDFEYQKAAQGEWRWTEDGWWFSYARGGYPADKWEFIYGDWYYFDEEGFVLTGWQKIDNEWYYFGNKDDGAMMTGWLYSKGNWFYMGPSGNMLVGWQQIGNAWYYMYSTGAMAHDTWIDGYYLNSTGAAS